MSVKILVGDCRDRLRELGGGTVHSCVTSPPFWKLRDYEMAGQLGEEPSPVEFAESLADVMAEVRRVLVPDGSVWLELGDSYAAGGNGGGGSRAAKRQKLSAISARKGWRSPPAGYKVRDLTLTPFLVADVLRAEGWFLRQAIIWDKVIATEPARQDRPSVAHSYIFLLTPNGPSRVRNPGEDWFASTIWSVRPSGATDHPAPMAPEIARRCIVSATQPGDLVLDPFGGSGTTALVADQLGRHAVMTELNPEYAAIAEARIAGGGLFGRVEVEA